MEQHQQFTGWRKVVKVVQPIVVREGKTLFIGLATLVGAIAFFAVTMGFWDSPLSEWGWIVFAATILALPKAFTKLKNSNEPLIVCFARAFREGFLSLPSIASEFTIQLNIVLQSDKTSLASNPSVAIPSQVATDKTTPGQGAGRATPLV